MVKRRSLLATLVSTSTVKARFSTCWNSSQLLPFAKPFLVNETRALYSRNFAHKGYRSARFIRTTCTLVIISKCLPPPWTFRGEGGGGRGRHRWDVVCRGFNESSPLPPSLSPPPTGPLFTNRSVTIVFSSVMGKGRGKIFMKPRRAITRIGDETNYSWDLDQSVLCFLDSNLHYIRVPLSLVQLCLMAIFHLIMHSHSRRLGNSLFLLLFFLHFKKAFKKRSKLILIRSSNGSFGPIENRVETDRSIVVI